MGRYLNGEFGALEAVDPHLSALLYAGDRLEAKPEIAAALSAGKIVLADRYIASNMAHQTARVSPEQRDEFLAWLKQLEYGLYGLPAEDLVIYLRVPVAEAHRLVGLKSARAYTNLKRDIQEADIKHLEQTAIIYDRLATETNWARIDCIDDGLRELCIRPRKSTGPFFRPSNRGFCPRLRPGIDVSRERRELRELLANFSAMNAWSLRCAACWPPSACRTRCSFPARAASGNSRWRACSRKPPTASGCATIFAANANRAAKSGNWPTLVR